MTMYLHAKNQENPQRGFQEKRVTDGRTDVRKDGQTDGINFIRPFLLFSQILKRNKKIFHAFLLNIRNYLPEVRNIQRRAAELNIILTRVNNFDIQQK